MLCVGTGGMTPTKTKAKQGLTCEKEARTSKRRKGAVEDSALRMNGLWHQLLRDDEALEAEVAAARADLAADEPRCAALPAAACWAGAANCY